MHYNQVMNATQARMLNRFSRRVAQVAKVLLIVGKAQRLMVAGHKRVKALTLAAAIVCGCSVPPASSVETNEGYARRVLSVTGR